MARRWARLADDEQADRAFTLAVDVRDEGEAYVLNALVPGLKAEDLSIQVLDDMVTVEGEFKAAETDQFVRELPHGSFRRSLRLPAALEAGKADAKITDGVLTLRLPKSEAARPKIIKVSTK
jgi:HSP20 family protein